MENNRTGCSRFTGSHISGGHRERCRYQGSTYDVCRARLGSCKNDMSFETKLVIAGGILLIAGILLFSCCI